MYECFPNISESRASRCPLPYIYPCFQYLFSFGMYTETSLPIYMDRLLHKNLGPLWCPCYKERLLIEQTHFAMQANFIGTARIMLRYHFGMTHVSYVHMWKSQYNHYCITLQKHFSYNCFYCIWNVVSSGVLNFINFIPILVSKL